MVPKGGFRNQPHGSKSGQPRPRNPSSSDVHDLKRGRASVGHEPLGALLTVDKTRFAPEGFSSIQLGWFGLVAW